MPRTVRLWATRTKRRFAVFALGTVFAALVGLGVTPAASAAPVQFFYVPFPEDQILAMLIAVENGGPSAAPTEPITSYVTITAIANGTIIYYDQWENGYDTDIANTFDTYHAVNNPDGTQIWGDGNTANGAPPGIPSDLIKAGTTIQLQNNVVTTTRKAVIDFDGGDKIAATKTIAVTRTSWAGATGTLFAGCVEVFDTNNWGTDYRSPVGVNLADAVDYQMFEYTALSIMAGEDGATIFLDANNDGDYLDAGDVSARYLAEGQSIYVTDVFVGARVVSDNPVQVSIFTGDVASNYESRDSALLPTHLWASRYYTPVSTPDVTTAAGDERTTVWLYNPGAGALTVTYERRNAAGGRTTTTVSVPAGGVAKHILENATDGTGSVFYSTSGAPFYAYSTTDSASATYTNNQAWDWSFTMIPQTMLTSQALVGLGIGRDPTSPTNPTENGNPVWVTTVGNGDTPATVYVDYDADPATGRFIDPNGNRYDAAYTLKELEQARIYVPPVTAAGVVHDSSSVCASTDGAQATLTFSHTTGTAMNRLMLVGVAMANTSATLRSVSSVTYGGVPLDRVGSQSGPSDGTGGNMTQPTVELWALANPLPGTANIVVTLDGSVAFVAGATTWSGVDLALGLQSAYGSFVSATGTGSPMTVDVATTAGQVVYDVVGKARYGNADPTAFTVGAGQTQRWTALDRTGGGNSRRVRGAGSTETAVGATTTMSWTGGGTYPWAIGAVPINPAPSSGKANQTGLLVYTLDTRVKLAVAWGQDPLTASAGAPGVDVGTSVPPTPEFTAGKDGVLWDDDGNPANGFAGDLDGDGYITCGDIIEYPITVINVSRLPVPDVVIWDEVPDGTTYVANSTYLDGVTLIPDNDNGTPYPLDGVGYGVGTLSIGQERTVTFRVQIDEYDPNSGRLAILNGGKGSALGWDDPVSDKAYLRGRISNYVWWDEDGDGIQDPSEGGIAGVRITLYRVVGYNGLDPILEPVFDEQGNQHYTVSVSDGQYDFKGLIPGRYVVEFVPPDDTQLTLPNQGGDRGLDSNPNPATNRTGVITIGGGQHDRTIDAGFVLITPTQAVVGSFGAYTVDGRVVVNWQTVSETGTAGYYVERQAGEIGRWVRVSDELVPALFESAAGGSYSLLDDGAEPYVALTYRLVEMEITGDSLVHGPYEVVAASPLPGADAYPEIVQGEQIARVPVSTARGHMRGDQTANTRRPGTGFGGSHGLQMRIETVDPGLYRVDAAQIASSLGLTEAQVRLLIATKGLKMTNQGKTVAYRPSGDGLALYFYGEAIDSVYTWTNVYWLAVAKGTVMTASQVVAGRDSTPRASYTETVHVEQDLFDYPAVFHDPESDFWLWDYLVAGYSAGDRMTVEVQAPDALGGLTLSVGLHGLSTIPQAKEHHVQVRLNGTVLGDVWWTGLTAHQANFPIPAGVLLPGANQVEIVAICDGGVPFSVVALDSLDLTYQRSTLAIDDRLLMRSEVRGLVQVDGLTSTDLWVLDVTSALSPRIVSPNSVGGDVGAAWVRFTADAGRTYLVATPAGAMAPRAMTAAVPSALRTARQSADYVVITADVLYDAASRLAGYRAGQGMSAQVVTTGQIYDNFNFGIASPHAIKSFIAHVRSISGTKARYVVLAGEGSYDYKDFAGFGDSLVPPLMVDTEYGLAPSDVLLADSQGDDGVPEVAIGRIPVLNELELDDALAKIQAYETAGGGDWKSSVTIAADNPDEGGDFSADGDGIAAALPGSVTVRKAYVSELGLAGARSVLLGSFADSALLVQFIGHGAVHQWAQEDLLSYPSVAGLPASARLPVVNALTCLVGQQALPGMDSLSEALFKRAGAGAIAVWAPSAMESNDDSVRLGKLFAQRVFGAAKSVRLGEAVRSSLQAGAGQGLPAWALRTYVLLGDPALRVTW